MSCRPTFLVIGAMKAGTTSLHRYLRTHPEVAASGVKETNFFLGRHEYRRGLEWYFSQFDGAPSVAVGEASPNYTKRHVWEGVPERIYRVNPDVRLIYVVRDPVKRIVSHYIHNYAHGRETDSLPSATTADSNYVKTSMYAYQIDAYLDNFPSENIMVVDSTRLRNETSSALREVFGFIGVNPDHRVPSPERRANISANKLRRSALERNVKSEYLRRLLQLILPSRFSDRQPFERPILSDEHAIRLADMLRNDIERFRILTGMPFSSWSV